MVYWKRQPRKKHPAVQSMNSRQRFRRLSPAERRVAIEAAFLLIRVPITLRLRGYAALRDRIERAAGTRPAGAGAARIAQLLQGVARRLPYQTTCLEQSVALHWMLRRRGIAAELCIGARKQEDAFEAHAWVECAGDVLNDDPGVRQRYAVFDGPLPARVRFS